MANLQVSVDKEQILKDGWHVLGLYDKNDKVIHLEVHNNREREGSTGNDSGSYYEVLTGKSIANFLATKTRGLLADDAGTIVLEFDERGVFVKAF